MIIRSALFAPVVALALTVLSPASSRAAVEFTFEQIGGNVVVEYFGSINTASLTFDQLYYGNYASIAPSFGAIASLRGTHGGWNVALTGPNGFGASGSPFQAQVHVQSSNSFGFDMTTGAMYLPNNYVSGASISGSFTYTNTTFADLSLTDGTQFAWTFGAGANADHITVTVGTPVPEPGTLALCGIGAIAGLVALRRRSIRK